MCGGPRLLLLDEPTAELDPRAVRQLGGLLAGLKVAKLVASHQLEFLRRVATRLVVLEQGAVAADGPIEEVLADAGLLERAGLL